MPLAVPILRALYVFLNVFETYKTLKSPPLSSRTGQPTIRAVSARKRAMKGCMTVWMVWACFVLYERTFDGIVGLLVPFYQELKSLVILFFILTRARGAEPIYLHILRPLIKPHTAAIDATLHFGHSFGDFLLLVARIPLEYALERYHGIRNVFRRKFSKKPPSEPEPTPTTTSTVQNANAPSDARPKIVVNTQGKRPSQGQPNSVPTGIPNSTVTNGAVRARRRPLETAHARSKSSSGTVLRPTTANPQPNHSKQRSQPEVWYPPPSAYQGENAPLPSPPSALPTPPAEYPRTNGNMISGPADEWRRYEAFPSAYPPTPLTLTANLPSEKSASNGLAGIDEEPRVVDEWRKYEAFPAAYPPTPLPSSSRLPQVDRVAPLGEITEEMHPDKESGRVPSFVHQEVIDDGYEGDEATYDSDEMIGGHEGALSERDMEVDEEGDDEDDYDEEEEDDFNITLQTPARMTRQHNFSAASSADPNDSTGLSTVDLGSPLRTRANSEATSEASSMGGKKRALNASPGAETGGPAKKTVIYARRAPAPPKFKIQPKANSARTQVPVRSRRPGSAAGVTTDDRESVEGSDTSSLAPKPRRPTNGTIRPVGIKQRPGIPSRSESDRTGSSDGVPRRPRVNPTNSAPGSSRPGTRPATRKVTDPMDSDRTLGRNSRSSTITAPSDDSRTATIRSRARVSNRT